MNSSNSPAVSWIALAIFINAWWIAYDVWAVHTKHWTMTHQMHDWLMSKNVGPWMYAAWAFVFILAMTHFIMAHYGK
jgi:hypothetical protein